MRNAKNLTDDSTSLIAKGRWEFPLTKYSDACIPSEREGRTYQAGAAADIEDIAGE